MEWNVCEILDWHKYFEWHHPPHSLIELWKLTITGNKSIQTLVLLAVTASKMLSCVNNSRGTKILVLLYSLEISALPSASVPTKSHRCCCSSALAVNIPLVSQVINLILRALSGHKGPQSAFSVQTNLKILPVWDLQDIPWEWNWLWPINCSLFMLNRLQSRWKVAMCKQKMSEEYEHF